MNKPAKTLAELRAAAYQAHDDHVADMNNDPEYRAAVVRSQGKDYATRTRAIAAAQDAALSVGLPVEDFEIIISAQPCGRFAPLFHIKHERSINHSIMLARKGFYVFN